MFYSEYAVETIASFYAEWCPQVFHRYNGITSRDVRLSWVHGTLAIVSFSFSPGRNRNKKRNHRSRLVFDREAGLTCGPYRTEVYRNATDTDRTSTECTGTLPVRTKNNQNVPEWALWLQAVV